jgi:hypothetical protein
MTWRCWFIFLDSHHLTPSKISILSSDASVTIAFL